ncbi:MAG: hypothetical protein ACYC5O_10125 [Anaerolineae bacterium]
MSSRTADKREPDPTAAEALRYEVAVNEERLVEVRVPFAPGERVVVFIVRQAGDSCDDLLAAASSTLSFWDNPYDDEDWNAR